MQVREICEEYCDYETCICKICETNLDCLNTCRIKDNKKSPYFQSYHCENFRDWIKKIVKGGIQCGGFY